MDDVSSPTALGDQHRPMVDHAIVYGSRGIVSFVIYGEHLPAHPRTERVNPVDPAGVSGELRLAHQYCLL
jgi:hypothetical protein